MKPQWMQSIIQVKNLRKMKTKHIDNLADLRQAKRKLKMKMALADQRAKEGFLYTTANRLFGSIEKNSAIQNSALGQNVNSSLNFLSDKATEKFNLGKTARSLISIAILVAAPIIAKKIQDFTDNQS